MGWLYCSSGNCFYFVNGIVAMVRKRGDRFEAFDLTSEDWTPVNDKYSPLSLGVYETLAAAKAKVEAR